MAWGIRLDHRSRILYSIRQIYREQDYSGDRGNDPHDLVRAELFWKGRTAELQTTSSDQDFAR